MDAYTYIAVNNPSFAKSICHKYGYNVASVRTSADLGKCLKQLVAAEGQPAFEDIMSQHPDREVLIELEKKNNPSTLSANGGGDDDDDSGKSNNCGCNKCKSKCGGGCSGRPMSNMYMNADGGTPVTTVAPAAAVPAPTPSGSSETNMLILVSAILIAFAIIKK